jgi:hypothetical protein
LGGGWVVEPLALHLFWHAFSPLYSFTLFSQKQNAVIIDGFAWRLRQAYEWTLHVSVRDRKGNGNLIGWVGRLVGGWVIATSVLCVCKCIVILDNNMSF